MTNAPLAGVVVALREVESANRVRGGVSRTSGPPPPAAIEIVQAYLAGAAAQLSRRDI